MFCIRVAGNIYVSFSLFVFSLRTFDCTHAYHRPSRAMALSLPAPAVSLRGCVSLCATAATQHSSGRTGYPSTYRLGPVHRTPLTLRLYHKLSLGLFVRKCHRRLLCRRRLRRPHQWSRCLCPVRCRRLFSRSRRRCPIRRRRRRARLLNALNKNWPMLTLAPAILTSVRALTPTRCSAIPRAQPLPYLSGEFCLQRLQRGRVGGNVFVHYLRLRTVSPVFCRPGEAGAWPCEWLQEPYLVELLELLGVAGVVYVIVQLVLDWYWVFLIVVFVIVEPEQRPHGVGARTQQEGPRADLGWPTSQTRKSGANRWDHFFRQGSAPRSCPKDHCIFISTGASRRWFACRVHNWAYQRSTFIAAVTGHGRTCSNRGRRRG